MTADSEIYALMFDLGDKHVRERMRELADKGSASATGLGNYVLTEIGGRCLPFFEKYGKSKKKSVSASTLRVGVLLTEFGHKKAVGLGLRILLDAAIANNRAGMSLAKVRTLVANQFKLEQDYRKLTEDYPDSFSRSPKNMGNRDMTRRQLETRRSNQMALLNHPGSGWSHRDAMMLASAVVEILVSYAGIFQIRQRLEHTHTGQKKVIHELFVRDEFFEWWDDGIDTLAAITPTRLPLISPPLDWDHNLTGGYPEDSGITRPLCSRGFAKYAKGEEFPVVLQSVNTLQRTAWKINTKVLDVFRVAIRNNWQDTGFQLTLVDKPKWPGDHVPKDSLEFETYYHQRRRHRVAEVAYRRDKLFATRLIYLADVYRDFDAMYFVHCLDFRSRVYPVSSALQYQGRDAERGLLQFNVAKPLGSDEALYWFYVHGANCYGQDKIPFDERVEWVRENSADILRSGEDPIEHRWWMTADSPWQFLAWCLEFAEMRTYVDPLDFPSAIPVAADGSNNGLQIYSLLWRDEVGGAATNCVPSDSPADAYQEVADVVTQRLRDVLIDPEASRKHQRWAQRILDFCKRQGLPGLPRSAVKRPVMTQPYGATRYSCQSYVIEWYFEWIRDLDLPVDLQPFPEKDVYGVFRWLGDLVWDSIGTVVLKAREAMTWLRQVSNVFAEGGKDVAWTTPLGFPVRQKYRKKDVQRVPLTIGRRLTIRVSEDTDELDPSKSRNGIAPNWVHSLDATAAHLTVYNASLQGVTHFRMIHDSFATHAADMPILAKTLRHVYADIFSADQVNSLYTELQESAPEGAVLPQPPSFGTLEPQQVKEAGYFFG